MTKKARKEEGSRRARANFIRILVARVSEMTSDSALPSFSPQHWVEDWLRTPHPALGNREPEILLDTDDGRRCVINLLGQIEAGAYA